MIPLASVSWEAASESNGTPDQNNGLFCPLTLSYGHVEGARQGEIIRGLTEPRDELPADVSELAKALVREMRGAEG